MGQLDASIAQLVLPTLQNTFHASLASVSWVALSYLLTLAATLPIFGRLADMFGRKMLYTGGFLIFIMGSAACGFASSLPILICTRAVQAVGAGLLQANSVAIITAAAGPQRGRAIGVQGAAQAIGLSLGPALGGLLIQVLGWQWVFWINVPFGLAGTLLGWLVLPRTEGLGTASFRFDWWGAALLAPALGFITLAVSEMATWGAGSPAFLGTLAAGITLMSVFVLHESKVLKPLVDLALFHSRAFSAGNGAGLISYALLFGVFLLLPFVLERGYNDAPFAAGLRLTAIPLAIGLTAPFSGALSDRFGTRRLTVGGMVVAALALAIIAAALNGSTSALLITTAAMVIFGIGQGLFTAPNNSAIMGAAPPSHLGAAAGVLNTMRTLGTSLGVALATVLLDYSIALHGTTLRLASPQTFTAGSREVLGIFAFLALVAAALSLMRGSGLDPRRRREIDSVEPEGGI
jgi:EmrB/QacA subfamily drug resistance transporter